jgi:tyrosyl-tRNA synthetase
MELRSMSDNSFLTRLENRLRHPTLDLTGLTAEQQFQRIIAKVADMPDAVISPDDLLSRLKESKQSHRPLRVKFGIDPTGPDIHIGHAVSLINLRLSGWAIRYFS